MSMAPVLFALKVYGIVIVISFLCALIIWLIVHVLATMGARKSIQTVGASAPAPAAVPAQPTTDTGIPPEHVAAIAAAVHHLLHEAAVLRIEDAGRKVAWVAEGRVAQHSSHNPVRNR